MNRILCSSFVLAIALSWASVSSGPAWAADEEKADLGQGALVGAGTQVMGDAAAESLVSPQVRQSPWWTTLKRAFTGAATGAVAAKTSGAQDAKAASGSAASKIEDAIAAATGAATTTAATGSPDAVDDGKDKAHEHKNKKMKHAGKKKHGKKNSEGHRPPGWDKGRKTGWGEGDVPPGLRNKEEIS